MFTHLFVLHAADQALIRIDIATLETSIVASGLTSVPDGIVVDPAGEHAYWTNMGRPSLIDRGRPPTEDNLDFYARNGSIERIALDGSGRESIVAEGRFVTGKQLAADWSAGRLYWADREGAAIRSVALDGSDLRDEVVVAPTEQEQRDARNHCVGIAIDTDDGLLYWTQKGPAKGGVGQILRSSLEIPQGQSAAEREVEILWSQLPEPIDLELNLRDGILYWTDRGRPPYGNTLNCADIPGPGRPGGSAVVLASGFNEAIGLAVDRQRGVAYTGDLSGEIREVNLDGSGDRPLITLDGMITGIAGA
ncbi:hypothetical protein ACTJJE_04500 [Mycolicibacterium sp. 22603]|uniref:hypothetical protein n=1 Tax=Mycolicibacterium sp. 22603 TaxID=3453950 RepID=UPI003F85F04A